MILPLRWKANKNVLLIIPELSSIFPNGAEDAEDIDVIHPPLGILYIAAYCRKYGYNVFVIDQMTEGLNDNDGIINLIEKNQINVVGITCTMSACYNTSIKYAKLCKSIGCNTVLGGVHVSSTIIESAKNEYTDVIIYGEGEETWIDLLNRINSQKDIVGTQGIAFSTYDGNVHIETKRNLIENLDDIPFPAYDKINMSRYVSLEALGIISSRGCNNRCTFCTSHKTWGQGIRYRSAENIISEIDMLVSKYGYIGKELLFYDDNFTANKERVIKLCDLMIERNYQIRWKCMSRVKGIDKEMLIAMKSAGCYSISFGFESAVDKSLKLMRKGVNLSDIENAIKLCVSVGIEVYGYFIIGFPWETKEDFNRTVDFIISHPEVKPALNFLTPYPGTTFYDEPKKWGITIENKYDQFTNLSIVMNSPNHTSQDLFDAYARYLIYMEERYYGY